MTTLAEDFLVKSGNPFNLDSSLPLRLQKRQLLDKLRFPGNKNLLPCKASDEELRASLFAKYLSLNLPFLVLVSEKPSHTIVPPMFFVNSSDEIIWRNNKDEKRNVTYNEALEIIARYGSETWLEFSDYIWSSNTIAGRLSFLNINEQIIELQIGVIPRQLLLLDERQLPVYSGFLNCFKLSANNYGSAKNILRDIGHKNILAFETVHSVVNNLGSSHFSGFEALTKIAPIPTLEFAITSNQSIICIDVDWPSQWKEV